MSTDLAEIAERSAAMEARVDELTQAFHDHVEREEEHQEKLLQELINIRQFLNTASTIGRVALWFGGSLLALFSAFPPLVQWLQDRIVFKP